MELIDRPMAGPGWPDTALDVLARAGWSITRDEVANVYAWRPDGRVLVAFLPEANDLAPVEVVWLVRTYDESQQVLWEATFAGETPAELIAAFLADLVRPEPLDPHREYQPMPGTPRAADTVRN